MRDENKTTQQLIEELKTLRQKSFADIAELKQAQVALRESEAHWRTLIDTLPDPVWLKDPEGVYLACNRRYEQILGETEAEILGKTDRDFEESALAATFHEQDRKAMATGRPEVNEVEVPFADDGHLELLETIKVPMYQSDGKLVGVLGIARDISGNRKHQMLMELQARRAEAMRLLLLMAEELDEAAFMQFGLESVEELTNSCISFVLFVEEDEESVELVTWSRRTHYDDHYPDGGDTIWAKALREHEPVVFNDHTDFEHQQVLAEEHADLKRLVSVPVIDNGKVVMLAGVGNKESDYTGSDVETIQIITNEIWRLVQHRRTENTVRRFSRVLERSLNEIYIFDSETLRFVDVNLGARKNLGYSIEELYSLTPVDLKPTFTLESFSEMLEPLRTGASQEIEFTTVHRRKDQTMYPIETHIQLVDEDPPVFLAILRDIDERLRMESELRKLVQAVEQSPESVVITDLNAEIEWVNEAFVRTTGFSREELIGRNSSMLKSGKTPPETFAALWSALKHGKPWEGEFFNKHKDGGEYVEFARIAPLCQPDGTITHYIGVKEDVTEKKQLAEELDEHRHHLEDLVNQRTSQLAEARQQTQAVNTALRESEKQFRQAARIAHLGHWRIDKSKREYTNVSEEYARIFGYTVDEYLERFANLKIRHELVHPEDLPRVKEIYQREDDAELEYRITRRDGSVRHVREIFSAKRDDSSTCIETEGTLQDITDIKRAEDELRKTKEAAEAANHSKSAFLANMSHEIRTPMNAIIGLTYLMQSAGPTAEQAEHLTRIDHSAGHLLSIINDILDLSKIEAGKLSLELSDFHLDTIFDNIQSQLTEQTRNKDLTIVVECDDVPIWLRGDVTRLRQALLNYAGNAVKFSECGTITLRARKLQEDDDGLLVRFEVQDPGIGIEPDKLPGLFEAFEQADDSTTRIHGGTGLGLAITKLLAQLMGGEVGAESEPGHGSTFWFTARLSRGFGRPVTQTEATPDVESALGAHYSGVRILLVDDNTINRLVARELLKGTGLAVETAENGREAVEMVRSTAYDLVLMDVEMPVMDGLRATREIRSMSNSAASNKDLPILAMTANIFTEDRRDCLEAGMNDFVAKPVEPASLFATLIKWLPKRHVADSR